MQSVRFTISRIGLLFVAAVLILAVSSPGYVHAQAKKLNVVATITIIQDIARNVAGDKANVESLVPTGGDVHEFEPKPEDIKRIANADLILVNGVGLERFIAKLITDSGAKGQIVLASRGLGIQKFQSLDAKGDANAANAVLGISGSYECGAPKEGEEIGECDPHLWQNVTNVIGYALNIRDALSAADPANADAYNANAGAYILKLQKLDADLFMGLSHIPAENRIFVTNHDALGYFATRYGFRVVGVVLPGGATTQEPNPKQVAATINAIKAQKVKAIFLENVSSDKLARQIAEQAGVSVVQALYTDALGEAGSSGATYIEMMYANLKTLQDALK